MTVEKKDIIDRTDIENLVNRFYDKVKKDDLIGFIFNDVAKLDWEKHLPTMYDFWEGIIFFRGHVQRKSND
jgi:hemoglobin